MFSASKLEACKRCWLEVFDKHGISPSSFGTPFMSRWKDPLPDGLAVLAEVLWGISHSLTEKSVSVFAGKLRELVQSPTEDVFAYRTGELEAAAFLTSRVSPIAFEPTVHSGTPDANKPKNVDYSITLPCGEILVEATCADMRGGDRDAEATLNLIRRKLKKKKDQLDPVPDRRCVFAMKILVQTTILSS